MNEIKLNGRIGHVGSDKSKNNLVDYFNEIIDFVVDDEFISDDGEPGTIKNIMPYKCNKILKALESYDSKNLDSPCWKIVKEKSVNIDLLRGTIKMVERGDTDWKYYNRMIREDRHDSKYELTEEEFDTLKKGLSK